MADLPRQRLDELVFPITQNGVNYFGPIEVEFLRRTMKKPVLPLQCSKKRPVHIKVAQSLDTESSLAAIARLITRRGYRGTIISTQGTNIIEAAKELKALLEE